MQSRFGIKDFITLALLAAVLISVWLSMQQKTRIEVSLRDMKEQVAQVGTQVSRLDAEVQKVEATTQDMRERLANGVAVAAPTQAATDTGHGGAGQASGGQGAAAPAGSDAWAVAGIQIERFPLPTWETDPTGQPGYATGGVFTELFEAQPAKMVPYLNQDVYGTRVIDRVAETLGKVDPHTLKLTGLLAEAWQVDPDGRWMRVRLHQRARFSDGQPVTADDVIFTFKDYLLNPQIEAERARSIMDNLVDVVRIDDRTVEFRFSSGLFNNPTNVLGNPILPRHYYSKFEPTQINQSTGLLVGSGPFRMQAVPSGPQDLENQWRPGTDVVLVRNEQYWATKPALNGLRYRTVNDELARYVAYTNGEGDMMMPASMQFKKVISDDPKFEKANYALNWVNMRSGYSFIAWQCGPRAGKKLTPFHDIRVRRAMTMLIDREQMIRDIYDNIGVVSKGPMNPESPASNPSLKPLPFDPESARRLLAEAGWQDRDGDGILENEAKERFEFEFTRASGGATVERLTDFLKASFAKAGILMKVRVVDWSVYTEIIKTRDFDALTMGWSANNPESDPRQIWHSESTKEGGDNFTQWSSPEADALIERGRREMDAASRQLIWQELERVIADGQAYTFMRVVPWLRFIKRDFGNVHPYKSGLETWEFFRTGSGAVANPG
jgi:peptide/nickel transport system substrate-binding protein